MDDKKILNTQYFSTLMVILMVFFLPMSFAQVPAVVREEVNLTTYYPTPSGAFGQMRLVPRTAGLPSCNAANEGLMFYDDTVGPPRSVRLCLEDPTNTYGWVDIVGGSATNYWARSGTNLYPATVTDTVSLGSNTSPIGGGRLQIDHLGVPLVFLESDQAAGTVGRLWRMPLDGTRLRFDVSPNGNNFTSYATALIMGLDATSDPHVGVSMGTGLPSIDFAVGDSDTGFNWVSDGNLDLYGNNIAIMSLRPNPGGVGHVGIRTANPLHALNIGDDDTGFNSPAAGQLDLLLNNTSRMMFRSGGVGIGTGVYVPATTLHIIGSTFIDASTFDHNIPVSEAALTVDGAPGGIDVAQFRSVGGGNLVRISSTGVLTVGSGSISVNV